ncbi:MAG: hypothetical protein ACREQY_19780 [Candidatus Binatia bacterium]
MLRDEVADARRLEIADLVVGVSDAGEQRRKRGDELRAPRFELR